MISKNTYSVKYFVLLALLCSSYWCSAQKDAPYFQQEVGYAVVAEYEYPNKITASVDIKYKNQSPLVLDTVFFHLWMNALSSKTSPFAKQMLDIKDKAFYFSKTEEMGGYEKIIVSIENTPIELQYKDNSKEIAFIVLPNSLKPNNTASIKIDYQLKLPKLFTRMGYDDEISKIVHWYPRVAVFDNNGWNTMPYLVWGETFGEFTDFDVTFTDHDSTKAILPFSIEHNNNVTHAIAKSVVDFPIIVYPKKETLISKTDDFKGIKITSNYFSDEEIWNKSIELAKDAITYFEQEIGPFPYREIQICQGSSRQHSAMEYPGLIIVNKVKSLKELDYYIAHELAHQYFYSALGFNERKEPYLDEGLATFYEGKYTLQKYGDHYYNSKLPKYLRNSIRFNNSILWKGCIHQQNRKFNQPLNSDPLQQSAVNYAINNYQKAPQLFTLIEGNVGKEVFKKTMKSFYNEWTGKHPTLIDLLIHFEKNTIKQMQWVLDVINSQQDFNLRIEESSKNKWVIKSSYQKPFPLMIWHSQNSILKDTIVDVMTGMFYIPETYSKQKPLIIDPNQFYIDKNLNDNKYRANQIKINILPTHGDPSKLDLNATPLITFNTSDKLMASLVLYNSTFPSKKFKWLLQPSYSFSNNALRGEGWVSYDFFYSKQNANFLQPYASVKSYAYEKNKIFGYDLSYNKLEIGLNHIATNIMTPHVLNKTSLVLAQITEDKSLFESAEEYTFYKSKFYILELKNKYKNNQALYPYQFETSLQYLPKYNDNDHFLKIESSYAVKMYYKPQKYFGLRLWGSYFLSNSKRNSLSYNNGIVKGSSSLIFQSHSDFSYDHYFLDRNANNINQSTLLGGGFKTVFNGNRTIGQSNNYAFAANLTSDLPFNLPKFLPLKLFLDVGLYDQNTNQNATKVKSIYSSGVTLSFLHEVLQIHLPLVNSDEINQIYKEEGGILNRISISINIKNLNPWHTIDQMNYYF